MPFKLLSIESFPEVTMSDFAVTLENTQMWLAEMDTLLTSYQDFVLVYNATDLCQAQTEDRAVSKQCRELVAEWFHEKRQLLKQKCRGVILPIQEGTDLTTIEVYREEIESYYKVPTEILYHPQDLPLLAHALMHDCWDSHSLHLHKVPAL